MLLIQLGISQDAKTMPLIPWILLSITARNLWSRAKFTGVGRQTTVYPKKYAHGFVVLCFVVVMQSCIINSHEVFIHIHQGCFAGTGAIFRLPQCQWSKPDGYGKISQCITTTKHSKAKTVCIFLGIYCTHACRADLIRNPTISLTQSRNSVNQFASRSWMDVCFYIFP